MRSVLEIIEEMDNLEDSPNYALLDKIMIYCYMYSKKSRRQLLTFVKEHTSVSGFVAHDPLIIFLMEMYEEEYGSIMRENLIKTTGIIGNVFEAINAMDDMDRNPDALLLRDIASYCATNTESSLFELLSFINDKIRTAGILAQDPLIVFLMEFYQREYVPFLHDLAKLKLKIQIDSLYLEPNPKDDLINLILEKYLQLHDIHAFLIIQPEQPTPPVEKGPRFFLPIEKSKATAAPIDDSIFQQIREKIHSHVGIERMFFIVRQQAHYTVIDYQASMQQCIIMDAAGDDRQLNLLQLYERIPEIKSIIYVKNENYNYGTEVKKTSLQKDNISCSIFSLDHVLSAGLSPNLHTKFKDIKKAETPNIGYITWFEAPHELVRNAQSPTFRNTYLERHPKTDVDKASVYLRENNFKKTVESIKAIVIEGLYFFPGSPSPLTTEYSSMQLKS